MIGGNVAHEEVVFVKARNEPGTALSGEASVGSFGEELRTWGVMPSDLLAAKNASPCSVTICEESGAY